MMFDFRPDDLLGTVERVDTSNALIRVINESIMDRLQVNQLVSIQSSRIGQRLIGLVSQILRNTFFPDETIEENADSKYNSVKVVLIGSHFEKFGLKENVFRRSLSTVPSVNAECYLLHGEQLKQFMQAVSLVSGSSHNGLQLGTYSIDKNAIAWLNGNKFFQRHAVIVGNTGSGKSWCVARILEQTAALKSANAILFDIHGEYSTLAGDNFVHLKIAGPNDPVGGEILFLPYWLLTYDEMLSLMLDRNDNNAPNQASLFRNEVIRLKQQILLDVGEADFAASITLDSPVPYNLDDLLEELSKKDTEMVPGARGGEKQGPYFGKLTRFIQRLESKQQDKRLHFLFENNAELLKLDAFNTICKRLMAPADDGKGGVKIIDFSEVPSDILPMIVSLIGRIVFSVQQWTEKDKRHPIALLCDEAHLYIPAFPDRNSDLGSLDTFGRISKEGRKYGVGLVVISQRPSEVSRTVLSQSNNFIAMRITNADDQNVIKRLLPDSLGDYAETLPILDVGEALVVGDASLLPSRIKISPPTLKPQSGTIDFWDVWSRDTAATNIDGAIRALRKQSRL